MRSNDTDSIPTPAVNRVLGATSGPYQGNVRAILAIILVVAFCALLFYAAVEYLHFGHEAGHDLVAAGFGALVAAFNGVTFFYLGKRTSEGG